MAIAWSRISSKVIAHPPYTNAACRRRCGTGKSHLGACIPQMVDKRKQEVLGACDAEVTPFSQDTTRLRRRYFIHNRWERAEIGDQRGEIAGGDLGIPTRATHQRVEQTPIGPRPLGDRLPNLRITPASDPGLQVG